MGKLKEKISAIKNHPKLLFITGLAGILLIFLSGYIPKVGKATAAKPSEITAEQYRVIIRNNVRDIVKGITGDENPTVVITLESGIRYDYANEKESDTSASSGRETEENRKATKQSYITVREADGGEKPLIVTEMMPEIRGVAIVCAYGDSPDVAQRIGDAVTAALNITSQRVYVSGGIYSEKR